MSVLDLAAAVLERAVLDVIREEKYLIILKQRRAGDSDFMDALAAWFGYEPEVLYLKICQRGTGQKKGTKHYLPTDLRKRKGRPCTPETRAKLSLAGKRLAGKVY